MNSTGIGRRRINIHVSRLVTIAGAALMTAGCDLLGTGTTEFIIRVDSISAPAAIAWNQTLMIEFHGPVGPDGCSSVARVDRQRSVDVLEITFHGERDGGGDCIQQPVALQHTETLLPPLMDPFTIRARQPSGPALERTVRVQ